MTDTSAAKPTSTRKISGIYIFLVLILIMVVIKYMSAVDTVYCDTDAAPAKPDVVMLGTTWCPYCAQARKYFHANKVSYCEYDIENSAKGEKMYQDINGSVIPILMIDGKHYSGFDAVAFEQLMNNRQAL